MWFCYTMRSVMKGRSLLYLNLLSKKALLLWILIDIILFVSSLHLICTVIHIFDLFYFNSYITMLGENKNYINLYKFTIFKLSKSLQRKSLLFYDIYFLII